MIFVVFAGFGLVACSYFNSDAKTSITQRHQLCAGIKRQLIFNQNTIGSYQTHLDISQKSSLERQYQKFDCDKAN